MTYDERIGILEARINFLELNLKNTFEDNNFEVIIRQELESQLVGMINSKATPLHQVIHDITNPLVDHAVKLSIIQSLQNYRDVTSNIANDLNNASKTLNDMSKEFGIPNKLANVQSNKISNNAIGSCKITDKGINLYGNKETIENFLSNAGTAYGMTPNECYVNGNGDGCKFIQGLRLFGNAHNYCTLDKIGKPFCTPTNEANKIGATCSLNLATQKAPVPQDSFFRTGISCNLHDPVIEYADLKPYEYCSFTQY